MIKICRIHAPHYITTRLDTNSNRPPIRTARMLVVAAAQQQSTSETSGAAAEPINVGPEKDKDAAGPIGDEKTERMKRKRKSINLHRGWPSASLLPAAALRAASQTALSDPAIWASGLEYAPDPGYQPLREALARWLGRFYRDVVPMPGSVSSIISSSSPSPSPDVSGGLVAGEREEEKNEEAEGDNREEEEADRITITGGASQGLACLLQSFTDPARTLAVWVVAPCYFLACPIFADAGFAGRMRAAPEDDEGVDVGILENEMAELEERAKEDGGRGVCGYKDPRPHRKIYRHVVYCVPAFANPSGRTMTLARRKALVALARRRDALVVCDDVYDMLQWGVESLSSSSSSSSSSTPSQTSRSKSSPADNRKLQRALLPRVVDLDLAAGRSPHDPPGKRFGHVVSNGSFSKLVAPGTRTGWTYSAADFALGASQTGSTRSGGAASQLAATIICQLLLRPSSSLGSRPAPSGGGDEKRVRGSGEKEVGEKERGEEEEEEEECELDRHIRHTLLPSYALRHALLMRAIRAELLPLGIRVREDSLCGRQGVYGGYFVWMTLPGGPKAAKTSSSVIPSPSSHTVEGEGKAKRQWPTAQAIAARCLADEDLLIGNGELFAVHGDEDAARFDDAIRLCFAWEDEANLGEGVERLGRVVRRMLEEGPGSWGVRDAEIGDADRGK
ncbi:pyridoxal phosphate-dependent transferase [Nemania serpens]|nr:pyridoxal phosphate-dependent transferase [Nemania serpens]